MWLFFGCFRQTHWRCSFYYVSDAHSVTSVEPFAVSFVQSEKSTHLNRSSYFANMVLCERKKAEYGEGQIGCSWWSRSQDRIPSKLTNQHESCLKGVLRQVNNYVGNKVDTDISPKATLQRYSRHWRIWRLYCYFFMANAHRRRHCYVRLMWWEHSL